MRKAILILVILILPLFYYLGAFSGEQPLPFSKDFFSIESPDVRERVWEIKRDVPLGQTELDQLYQLKLDRGIQNVPTLSFFLIRESRKAREKGDFSQAVLLDVYAKNISPGLPQPYFELAHTYWQQSMFQPDRIIPELIQGTVAIFHSYSYSLRLFYNILYIFSNAVLMVFIVFGVFVMIQYYPLYFHKIKKDTNKEVLQNIINLLKIAALFIPLFLRLDILWAIYFWSILLWGYVTKKEKIIIVVFLIVLVYVPYFLRTSSAFLNDASSNIVMEMDKINNGEGEIKTEGKLQTWLQTHSEDAEVMFTLGLSKKRLEDYSEAEKYYIRAIQQNPQLSEAFSSLGNVYLAQKQVEKAIALYQQATDLAPDCSTYYYNLSRAYSQESFLTDKQDNAFQRARQLNPELIDEYTKMDLPNRPANYNRLVIDKTLSSGRLWRRSLIQFIGKDGSILEGILYYIFYQSWFKERVPSSFPVLIPFIFLGVLACLTLFGRTRRYATRCSKCGTPTQRFYVGKTHNQDFICFNCYRIYIQKEKLHQKIFENKTYQTYQIQKENYYISIFVSCFVIGFGYLWRRQIVKGLLLLLVYFVFIVKMIYWNGAIPSSLPLLSLGYLKEIVWIGLFVLFYLFSIYRLFQYEKDFRPKLEMMKNR